MGVEKKAFMIVAFIASGLFANKIYFGLLLVPILHMLMQWMTKKEYYFFEIFMRYLNESDAYSALSRPDSWSKRPIGWGRGLPW